MMLELGEGRFVHPGGALWLAGSRTVLIADVHLGYGWAQRRRGELGPVADAKSGERLGALVAELAPARVVFLGDLVHAPRPGADERAAIEDTLGALAGRTSLILARGNHDRGFSRDFGGIAVEVVDVWVGDGIAALHGDRLGRAAIPEGHLVVGHLHPVMKIKDSAGASQRVRVLLHAPGLTVLPAFSPYSGGFEIGRGLPGELARLAGGPVEAVAVTGRRAVRVGPVRGARS